MNALRTLALAACVAGLSALVPQQAEATTFKKMTADEAIASAEWIVRGTITEVWSERDEGGLIWTRAQVEIAEEYKGDAPAVMVVDQMGGKYGSLEQQVGAAANFSVGEEVILFLEPTGSGRVVLQRMHLGKMTIRIDPHSGREIVQQFVPLPGQTYDHRFIPAPKKQDRRFLSDIEARILDTLEAQSAAAQPTEVK